MTQSKAQRKGVFVGAYVSPIVREYLKRRSKASHITVSEVIREILVNEMLDKSVSTTVTGGKK